MNLRSLVLIRLGVAVNLVIGQLAAALLLPVFLDAIGTILVAAMIGPRAAIVTGLVSQILAAVLSGNFAWLPFAVVQVVIAVYAGMAARLRLLRSLWTAIPAGVVLGALAGATAAPIAYYVFGGGTAGGVTAVTTALRALGVPLQAAVYASSLGTDLIDKTISFALVCIILRTLPSHLAARFPGLAR